MQKAQHKHIPAFFSVSCIVVFLFVAWSGNQLQAQTGKTTVTYYSADSLLITADRYVLRDSLPYVVLIHEQGSSRGEFSEIIDRFQKMNFNCLAADIRNGGNSNFIGNESAKRSRAGNFERGYQAIEGDIIASVHEANSYSGKEVILLGAGANGSLAIKAAKEDSLVKAAIALSPGEYFLSSFMVEDTVAGIQKPVLITSSRLEFPYAEQLASGIEEEYKTIFAPENGPGARGTNSLLSGNDSEGEYWLALLLFFKDLQ